MRERWFGSMGSETESLFLLSHLRQNIPVGSMYGIFTYIWFMFMKHLGKYIPYTGKNTLGFGISGWHFFSDGQQVNRAANARPLLWSSGSWQKKFHNNFQRGVGLPLNRNNEKLHRNTSVGLGQSVFWVVRGLRWKVRWCLDNCSVDNLI